MSDCVTTEVMGDPAERPRRVLLGPLDLNGWRQALSSLVLRLEARGSLRRCRKDHSGIWGAGQERGLLVMHTVPYQTSSSRPHASPTFRQGQESAGGRALHPPDEAGAIQASCCQRCAPAQGSLTSRHSWADCFSAHHFLYFRKYLHYRDCMLPNTPAANQMNVNIKGINSLMSLRSSLAAE